MATLYKLNRVNFRKTTTKNSFNILLRLQECHWDTAFPTDSAATIVVHSLSEFSQTVNSLWSSFLMRKCNLNGIKLALHPHVPYETVLSSNYPATNIISSVSNVETISTYCRNGKNQTIRYQIRSHVFNNIELSGPYFRYCLLSDRLQLPIESLKNVFEHQRNERTGQLQTLVSVIIAIV